MPDLIGLVEWNYLFGCVLLSIAMASFSPRLVHICCIFANTGNNMSPNHFRNFLCAIVIALSVAGCASIPDSTTRKNAVANIAAAHGLTPAYTGVGAARVFTSAKVTDPTQTTRVYIEGDGFAYIGGGQPSNDPTPTKPVLMSLIGMDASPNIVYIARPCQYGHEGCTVSDWTTNRFAADKVAAINAAIDDVKARYHLGPLELVGYSGGAHFAALLAATRCDVVGLRSIAGNLDVPAFTAYRHQTPLNVTDTGLNHADALRAIPQLHIASTRDTVIPPVLVEGYIARLASPFARTMIVDAPTHGRGWEGVWPAFLAQPLPEATPRATCL